MTSKDAVIYIPANTLEEVRVIAGLWADAGVSVEYNYDDIGESV